MLRAWGVTMNKKLREHIAEILKNGEDIPADYQEDLFPTTKKEYELKYAGKERKEKILSDTMSVPFQAIKHFGTAKEGDWVNKLIFGDNLQALKHLLKLKKEGKLKNADGTDGVRLVYIDPPFATKRDFAGNQGQKAYQDKILGSSFIEYLRKRLILLCELMEDKGVIFLHLDYKKSHYMKIILDEIFGEHNFINNITWQRFNFRSDAKAFGRISDVILVFSKSENYTWNKLREDYRPEYIKSHFKKDDHGKLFRHLPLYPPGDKGPIYELNGLTRAWRFTKEKMQKLIDDGKIYFPEKGKAPSLIMYLADAPGKVVSDLWNDVPFVNPVAKERINYPTQKPEVMLKRIIESCSNEGDIVLDCFAGSGTTGAVAEKLGRRWIMADCGKLAIYTIQKRMMNLKKDIGNKGADLKPRPFVLYNAGLYYDGKLLEHMQKDEYKEFVLELFGCQKRDHEINGLDFHGTLNNHSVMVFDKEHYLTGEFVEQLHKTIGKNIKSNCFIIAPAGIVGFGEDYIKKGDKRYTVLRIPNSIIAEIRKRNFDRLQQPKMAEDVNQTIDAVGFDFIYPPRVKSEYYFEKPKGKLTEAEYNIEIKEFEPIQLGSKIIEFKDPKSESLAMVMIDFDYDGDTFQMDKYWFGSDITKNDFKVSFDDQIGDKIMIIYLDIFGNEKKEVLKKGDFDKR
jgi:DNA modification methylase